ncbi:hypothetical protein [Geothrix sp.]|jgi:YHS domain-containing protein|uniref:hypothetical protein n=1 Tax=Geothrix sp. TaxID=1962974 RepID=UPI0025BF25C2|nr:hypothetical protein [Geothrix sp.]
MIRATLIFLTVLATASIGMAKPATNGRCPVLGNPVSNRNQVVTVHGPDYYICSSDCGDRLTADPDKYLDSDGKPKNITQSQSTTKIRDRY